MAAVETATDDGTLEAFPLEDDERVSGPHTGYDTYGNVDHRYWTCADCGAEATRKVHSPTAANHLLFSFMSRQTTSPVVTMISF